MTELFMLVVLYGVFPITPTSGTMIGPAQIGKIGPMDFETCQRGATGLNAASGNFHAQCENLPRLSIQYEQR